MNPEKDTALELVCDPARIEEERENRKLRHWIIKGVFFLIAFIVVMVVLSVLYDFLFRGGDLNESVIQTFFSNLANILKFMFES